MNDESSPLIIDVGVDIHSWLEQHPKHLERRDRRGTFISLIFCEDLLSEIVLKILLKYADMVICLCIIAGLTVLVEFLSKMNENAERLLDGDRVAKKRLTRIVIDDGAERLDDGLGMNDQFLLLHRSLVEVICALRSILVLLSSILVDCRKPNRDAVEDFKDGNAEVAICCFLQLVWSRELLGSLDLATEVLVLNFVEDLWAWREFFLGFFGSGRRGWSVWLDDDILGAVVGLGCSHDVM